MYKSLLLNSLNILFWARLKSFICNISFLEILRPQSTLFIESKFGDVLFKLGKYGMPSFHSIYSGYMFMFWTQYFLNTKKKKSKIKIFNLFLLYILVVSSRIYFNVHTLGQVLVGSILGFLSGKISFYVYSKIL